MTYMLCFWWRGTQYFMNNFFYTHRIFTFLHYQSHYCNISACKFRKQLNNYMIFDQDSNKRYWQRNSLGLPKRGRRRPSH